MRVVRELPISAIMIYRYPLCPRTLDLVRWMAGGGSIPPIHVLKTPTGYRILDGRHRLTASKLLGRTHIKARYGVPVEVPHEA